MIGNQHQDSLIRKLFLPSPSSSVFADSCHWKSSVHEREQLLEHRCMIVIQLQTPLNAENPPSTGTTIPVTKAEAGETSHIVHRAGRRESQSGSSGCGQ